MSPSLAIAMLDRQLGRHGQAIKLQRPGAGAPADLACRAFVRGYKPDELSGTITQEDSLVILSPSALSGAWTEVREGDRVFAEGSWRRVMVPGPFRMNDVLVRIELQVRGL